MQAGNMPDKTLIHSVRHDGRTWVTGCGKKTTSMENVRELSETEFVHSTEGTCATCHKQFMPRGLPG